MPPHKTDGVIDPFRYLASAVVDYDNDEVWEHKPVDFQEYTESKEFCNLKWDGRKGCRPKIMEIGWEVVQDNVREAMLLLGKGSYASNTMITLYDTKTVSIGELFRKFEQDKKPVKLLNIDEKTNKQVVSYGIPKYSGKREVWKVTTSHGHVFEVTPNHNMITFFGRKRMEDLKVGDGLCVSRKIGINNNKDQINEFEARFLGYIIADGHIGYKENYRCCFTKVDPVIIEDFLLCIKNIEGNTDGVRIYKSEYPKLHIQMGSGLCQKVKDLIDRSGLSETRCHNKFIPDIVKQSSNQIVAEFLRAYWSCDGECTISKAGKHGIRSCYLSVTTKSEKLINDVRDMLLRFGIYSKIKRRKKNIKFVEKKTGIDREYNNYKFYEIYFGNSDTLLKFYSAIKLLSVKGKRQVKQLKINAEKKAFTDKTLLLPLKLSEEIKDKCIAAGISQKDFRKNVTRYKKISVDKLDYVKPLLSMDKKEFTEGNVHYTEIVEIKKLSKKQKTYDITILCGENNNLRNYIAGGIITSNSGKDFLAALLHSYGIYKCLCMYNPQDFYGLSPGSNIYFINIARNEYQAKNVFFTEFSQTMIKKNAWMHGRHAPISSQRINFEKGVVALSANSQGYAWLGYHTLQAVFDEMAFYIESQEKKTMEDTSRTKECWEAAYGSCITRFPKHHKMIGITTPNQEDDFTMKKFYELKGRMMKENPDAYVAQGASWDINPNTPIELFEERLKRDRRRTMRDYGAEPMGVMESFWADPKYLQEHVCDTCKACPIYQRRLELDDPYACFNYEECMANGYEGNGNWRSWFIGDPDIDYYMHVDLAKNKDRIGFAVAHVVGTKEVEITEVDKNDLGIYNDDDGADEQETQTVERPLIKIDAVGFVDTRPDQNARLLKNGEFYYDNFLKFIIYKLQSIHVNLALVTFDQYQSFHAMQNIEDHGIDCDLLSLDRVPAKGNPYPPDSVKIAITEGRVEYPFNMVLCAEARNLKVINGTKVDHAYKESKDVWDGFAGAIWNAESNTSTGIEFGTINIG